MLTRPTPKSVVSAQEVAKGVLNEFFGLVKGSQLLAFSRD